MVPRQLFEKDYKAAQSYAARFPSDPFAFMRACHALKYNIVLASEVEEGSIG